MANYKKQGTIRKWALAGVGVLAITHGAAYTQGKMEFGIEPMPLGDALNELGMQSGEEIIFVEADAHGKLSEGVEGPYAADEALDILLNGSGVDYRINELGAYPVGVSSLRQADAGDGSIQLASLQLKDDQSDGGAAPVEEIQRDERNVIDRIVVTALKREGDVQDVPVSISVQDGETLMKRNLTQLTDYAINVPGLNVSNLGTAGLASVNIRGVASVSNSASVGTYLDDVPLGSSSRFGGAANQILDVLPYDLDRIEVLRGPQGTLYGAGSMGGLIKYVLKQPDTTDTEFRIGSDVGIVNEAGGPSYSVRAMLNVPLIEDSVALRVSLWQQHKPGYIDNAFAQVNSFAGATDINDQDRYGGRAALKWAPSDNLSVNLGAMVTRNEADDGGTVTFAGFDFIPAAENASIGRVFDPVGELTQSHAFPQEFDEEVDLLTATINWKPGPFDVVSATSWSDRTTRTTVDQTTAAAGLIAFGVLPPGTLLGGEFDTELQKFTQEIRLSATPGSRFEWLLGGFYTEEKVKIDGALDGFLGETAFLRPALSTMDRSSYEEIALFGDAIWHVTETLGISGGIRFARIDQDFSSAPSGPFAGASLFQPPTSEEVVTWSASAHYDILPETMLYARIATGFRAGGLNPVTVAGADVPATVDSDNLTSYELGIKSQFQDFFDNRTLVNVTLFQIDWSDIQLNSTQGGNTILTNGGEAKPKGIEATIEYDLFDNLTFGFNGAYTKSEIETTAPGVFFVPGFQLPGVPKKTYALSADYNVSLNRDWSANLGLNWRWVDDVWATGVQTLGNAAPAVRLPSYSQVNLQAGVSNDKYSIRVYVNNLTDERALQGGLVLIDVFNSPQQGDFYVLQPRSIGIAVDAAF